MFTYRRCVNTIIISILTVNLITNRITTFFPEHKHITNQAKVALIGVLLTVIVLYPALSGLTICVRSLSNRFKNW